MKVCYILPHFYPHVGGGEQAFLDLIEELVKQNIRSKSCYKQFWWDRGLSKI